MSSSSALVYKYFPKILFYEVYFDNFLDGIQYTNLVYSLQSKIMTSEHSLQNLS